MNAMQEQVDQAAESASLLHTATMLGFAAAASALMPALLGGAGSLLPSLLKEFGTRASTAVGKMVWQTATRVLSGDSLSDALWDGTGHLVLSVASPSGARHQVLLAGIRRSGLEQGAADRVVATVKSLMSSKSAVLSALVAKHRAHAPIGSVLFPDSRMDLSAELLRRGLVQLDVTDHEVLAQQPGLVGAAREALDDEARHDAIADPTYRRLVERASASSLAK
jgi:hypothetical protein